MVIIPAKDLTGIYRGDIVDCFCDYLMKNIQAANAVGKKQITFTLPDRVFGNPHTKQVSEKYERNWPYCPFEKKDYEEEVAQMFRNAGYRVYQPKGCAYTLITW